MKLTKNSELILSKSLTRHRKFNECEMITNGKNWFFKCIQRDVNVMERSDMDKTLYVLSLVFFYLCLETTIQSAHMKT